jgi:hypothetical protein
VKYRARLLWLRPVQDSWHEDGTGPYKILCGSCRFFRVWPAGFEEPYPDVECDHPLEVVRERNFEGAWEGMDCWAFRPKLGAKPEDD